MEIAYVSAAVNKLGGDVTATDLQKELDKVAITDVTDNGDGTLNVLFDDTEHNYNVDNGKVSKVEILEAGLYDADKNLVASWETLINTYGLDIEKNYTPSTFSTDTSSPSYILTNSSELSTGSILVIDDSITRLGDRGFTSCVNLTNIIIPNSVTEIGTRAIQLCDGLTSIKIPNSVTTIGDSAFNCCTNLSSISIPNSVVTIERNAFNECTSLSNIVIPDSVTTIGDNAFYGCTNLKSISLSNSISSLAYNTFYNCTNLSNVVIPDSVTAIGDGAFRNCTSLENITIPENVAKFGSDTFRDCTSLKNVVICDGSIALFISPDSFYGCSNLKSMTIPKRVSRIGSRAFYGCKSLTEIYIPNSVTTIDASTYSLSPFGSCSSLIIYCESTEKQSGWGKFWNYYSSGAACATNYGYSREQYEAELNS